MTKREVLNGKPYVGNPHVRFDEGEVAPAATPRRGSLLYNSTIIKSTCGKLAAFAAAICTMSAVLADVDDLDNYRFRYDFSSGDRVYYGSDAYPTDPLKNGKDKDIVALPVTGPNGANTAVHPDEGGGWTTAGLPAFAGHRVGLSSARDPATGEDFRTVRSTTISAI